MARKATNKKTLNSALSNAITTPTIAQADTARNIATLKACVNNIQDVVVALDGQPAYEATCKRLGSVVGRLSDTIESLPKIADRVEANRLKSESKSQKNAARVKKLVDQLAKLGVEVPNV